MDRTLENLALRVPEQPAEGGLVVEVSTDTYKVVYQPVCCCDSPGTATCTHLALNSFLSSALQDLSSTVVSRLDAYGSSSVVCTLLPMKEGLQKLQAVELISQQDGRILDVMDIDCFVNR